MKAMVLETPGRPLRLVELERPRPGPGELLVQVLACGVCRTDLHVVDGELPHPKLPLVPGHEIVGTVVERGAGAVAFPAGARVGIGWLGQTCGTCRYCLAGSENLCDAPEFTGYTVDGGYAEFVVADQRYCFALPEHLADHTAAPMMCAGLIGYRSLKFAGPARRLGIYGFGATAHIIAQVAVEQGREVYAFTRPGDAAAQEFAVGLGASWVGDSTDRPPLDLGAAIIFAPVGALVPQALGAVCKGGTVVCGGIHMSDIPSFPYALLWGERLVRSVANLSRQDAREFLAIAGEVPIAVRIEVFPLAAANDALQRLRDGRLTGAAVLVP